MTGMELAAVEEMKGVEEMGRSPNDFRWTTAAQSHKDW